MRSKSLLLSLIAAVCSIGGPLFAQQPDEIDAKSIIDRASRTYSDLTSYQDTGIVERIMERPGKRDHRIKAPFQTAFKHADKLRFEWTETLTGGQTDQHVVCYDQRDAFTYWENLQQHRREKDLRSAIAGATGISGGAVGRIPGLLLETKAWGHTIFSSLSSVVRIPDDIIEGVPCFVIAGKDIAGSEKTLWIGRDDYLVRQIEEISRLGKLPEDALKRLPAEAVAALDRSDITRVLTRETHRDIQVNHDIPDDFFTFVPPHGSRLVEEYEVDP